MADCKVPECRDSFDDKYEQRSNTVEYTGGYREACHKIQADAERAALPGSQQDKAAANRDRRAYPQEVKPAPGGRDVTQQHSRPHSFDAEQRKGAEQNGDEDADRGAFNNSP